LKAGSRLIIGTLSRLNTSTVYKSPYKQRQMHTRWCGS